MDFIGFFQRNFEKIQNYGFFQNIFLGIRTKMSQMILSFFFKMLFFFLFDAIFPLWQFFHSQIWSLIKTLVNLPIHLLSSSNLPMEKEIKLKALFFEDAPMEFVS